MKLLATGFYYNAIAMFDFWLPEGSGWDEHHESCHWAHWFQNGMLHLAPPFLSYLLTYVKCGKCSHMSHSKPSVDGLRSYTNLLTGLIMKWIVNEHGSHLEVSIHAGTPVRIHFLCGILHEINHPAIGVPSGIQKTMENHNFSWVNPL